MHFSGIIKSYMKYKDMFAIADEKLKVASDYTLKNYDCYKPKLEKEFYLKYFRKRVLFEVDILEIEDFLDYHYSESSNADMYVKILKQKIVPTIKTIISQAEVDLSGGRAFEQIDLEDGFIESEGVIFKPEYELRHLLHLTALNSLQYDLEERLNVIKDYVTKIENLKSNKNPNLLKWKGKPSHLALIIKELIDYGYIEAPVRNNKDINISELARNILSSFDVVNSTTENTLREYSKEDSFKYIALRDSFKNKGFCLPNSAEFD